MVGACIFFSIFAVFCVVGGIYMIVTKKPVIFHGYHYANMSAKARRQLAVYGGLGMFVLGIAFTELPFYFVGWPPWMRSEYGTRAVVATYITGIVAIFLSVICCKGRLFSWIQHWREDQNKNCDD